MLWTPGKSLMSRAIFVEIALEEIPQEYYEEESHEPTRKDTSSLIYEWSLFEELLRLG